jgi:hypothetical protein
VSKTTCFALLFPLLSYLMRDWGCFVDEKVESAKATVKKKIMEYMERAEAIKGLKNGSPQEKSAGGNDNAAVK